ncbi:formate C-acetyltransferase [Globicatella sulfidifaciens]
MKAWEGFNGTAWREKTDVGQFILDNYTEYTGDESFLAEPTEATNKLNKIFEDLLAYEVEHGVVDMEEKIVSTVLAYPASYIDKDLEKIVGLQTDKPLKQGLNPFGGVRMAKQALEAYGYSLDPEVEKQFDDWIQTHNQGVFDVYDSDIRAARSNKILTGLPDAYGRGRIIGDYRRVALYGTDYLRKEKFSDWNATEREMYTEEEMQTREEISRQYRALGDLAELGKMYGCDLTRPAQTAQEAIQWTYFGFLAGAKQTNGAATSLGRMDAFFDIYFERDLKAGLITEEDAQELMDHFVMKLRMIRFARTPEFNEVFAGMPTWVTLSIAGMNNDGRSLVTKTSFRALHTLYTMGESPEPNLTIFYNEKLPRGFREYCAKVSIDTSAIQYENDEVMATTMHSTDAAIACCVSPSVMGKEHQYFGARFSGPKALLYAVSGGVDEKTRKTVIKGLEPIKGDYLEYDELMEKLEKVMDWTTKTYVRALNIIHRQHDRYAYESTQMALLDSHPHRYFATGIAGLALVGDMLSAVKYSKVRIVRDEDGFPVDYVVEGEQFPTFGNNDDRVDSLVTGFLHDFMEHLRKLPTYRNAEITTSILTITSNIVYGKALGNVFTGSNPEVVGYREPWTPIAPGANPQYNSVKSGALAALSSVAKIPFDDARDGSSYTFAIHPKALGRDEVDRKANLATMLDGYFKKGGHHLNVNVLNREKLIDILQHPEENPHAVLRVSGYALYLNKATQDQINDILQRVIHNQF